MLADFRTQMFRGTGKGIVLGVMVMSLGLTVSGVPAFADVAQPGSDLPAVEGESGLDGAALTMVDEASPDGGAQDAPGELPPDVLASGHLGDYTLEMGDEVTVTTPEGLVGLSWAVGWPYILELDHTGLHVAFGRSEVVVTATGHGTTTLTAVNPYTKAAYEYTFTVNPPKITSLSIGGPGFVTVGHYILPWCETVPEDPDFPYSLDWSSSDEGIAYRSGSSIYGVSPGEATFTVTSPQAADGVVASRTYTVYDNRLTIDGARSDVVHDGEEHSLSGFELTGLPEGFTYQGIVVTPATGADVGTYEGSVDHAGLVIRDSDGKDVTRFFDVVSATGPALKITPGDEGPDDGGDPGSTGGSDENPTGGEAGPGAGEDPAGSQGDPVVPDRVPDPPSATVAPAATLPRTGDPWVGAARTAAFMTLTGVVMVLAAAAVSAWRRIRDR